MRKESSILMVYNSFSGLHRAKDAAEGMKNSHPNLGLVAISIASLNNNPSLIMQFPDVLILGGDGTHFSATTIAAEQQAISPKSLFPTLGFLNFGSTGIAANNLGLVRHANELDSNFLNRIVNSVLEGNLKSINLSPGKISIDEKNQSFFWNICFGQIFTGALLGVNKHRERRQPPILRRAMGLVEVIKNYDPKNPQISIHFNGQKITAVDAGVINPIFGLWPRSLFGHSPNYVLYFISGGDRYQTAAKLLIDMVWGVLTNKEFSFKNCSLTGAVSQVPVNEDQNITMIADGYTPLSIDSEVYNNGAPVSKVEVLPVDGSGKPVTVYCSEDHQRQTAIST